MRCPTTAERIILHLSRYPYSSYREGYVPYALTQSGIAESLGISRNYVAVVISRMERAGKGWIFSEVRHVQGLTKKRKVYFLSPSGAMKAREIAEVWMNVIVKIRTEDGYENVRIRDIGKWANCRDCVIEAILSLDGSGVVSFRREDTRRIERVFVGRESYLKRFSSIMDEVERGHGGRCVLIYGDPGIGKTTLASRFVEGAKRRGWKVLSSRGYSNLSEPYLPVIDMTRDGDVEDAVGAKIEEILGKVSSGEPERGEFERERIAMWYDITEIFSSLSKETPLIIFVDDLHWVDVATLKLLYFILTHSSHHRIIFIGAYRQEGEQRAESIVRMQNDLVRLGVCVPMPLAPLSKRDIKKMLSNLFGEVVPDHFVEEMARVSGGNPLFVEEIAKQLLRDGVVDPEKGVYPSEIGHMSIPSSVESVIIERLSSLNERERMVVEISSVIGENVPYILLKKVSEMGESEILSIIGDLIRKGIFRDTGVPEVFAFYHPLVHRVVYENLSESVRHLYHRIVARNIEDLIRDGWNAEPYADLGYHYERGGKPEKAVEYYYSKAMREIEVYAYEDALETLYRALNMARVMGDEMWISRILVGIGDIKKYAGNYDDALSRYFECLNFSKDGEFLQGIYLKIARCYREMGELKKSLKYVNAGLNVSSLPTLNLVKLFSEKVWLLLKFGAKEDISKTMAQMELIAENVDDDLASAIVMENKATLLYYSGDYDEAMRFLKMAIDHLEGSTEYRYLSILYTNLGILIAQTGDLVEAIKYFQKSKRIEEKMGTRYGLAQVYTNLGVAYHRKGNLRRAMDYFKRGMEIYSKIGSQESLATVFFNVGNILLEQGFVEDALEYFRRTESIFERKGDLWGLCHVYGSMADAYLKRLNMDLAKFYVDKAMDLSEKVGGEECRVNAYIVLVKLLVTEGKDDEISKYLDELDELSIISKDPSLSARVDHLKALVLSGKAPPAEIERYFRSAYSKLRKLGERTNLAVVLCDWALYLKSQGQHHGVDSKIKRAREIFLEEGMEGLIEKCKL